jgi:hypothetical protein
MTNPILRLALVAQQQGRLPIVPKGRNRGSSEKEKPRSAGLFAKSSKQEII